MCFFISNLLLLGDLKKLEMTIDEIQNRLKVGNQRFVADSLDGKLQDSSRRQSLASGQEPFAIILSCADSRVVPELIFDTGLGELFVVRVAGNIANSSSIGSIEYAVAHCGAQVIVVMGHESCGAVSAAVAGGDNGEHINHLVAHIKPALDAISADAPLKDKVIKNAHLSKQNLLDNSPIIKDAVDNGTVKVITAYYTISTGAVDFV